MKPKSTLRSFLLLAGSTLLAISSASAATLYYDGGTENIAGNGDSAASGLTGEWGISLLNWDAGLVPYVGWNNSNNDTAFFHRGTAIPGPNPGTVSLTGDITVGGIVFNASTYNISTGANALTFGGTNNTVFLNNRATAATITGNIASSAANMTFTAQNPLANHTLTFTGANSTGWSGTTTVNAGLTLATTSTSGNINQTLNSTSGITLNGGALQFNRATNAALDAISDSAAIAVNGGGTFGATSADAGGVSANETIGAVTLNSGQLNLNWTNNPSSGGNMVLSGFTRSGATSALTVSFGANGRFRNNAVVTDTAANEIIGPWATTGGQNGINAQSDYAVYGNGDGTFLARNIAASAESTWSTTHAATSNYTLNMTNVTAAANGRLTANRNINTLRGNTNSTAPSVVDADTDYITMAGNDLLDGDVVVSRNTTGGQLTPGRAYYVINKDGAGAGTFQVSTTPGGAAVNLTTTATGFISAGVTLNGSALGTYGILAGASDPLAIGGSGSVTLPVAEVNGNLYVTNGNASVWIDAPITDNGAGALTLVKGGSSGNGSGNVTLSGNNTYTGGTVINAGNLTFTGTNNFSAGDIINGGSITYSTIASWGGAGRDVTFNGSGALTSTVVGYSGGTLTSNAGANAVITSTSNGSNGSTQIAFATTTGAGNVIYSAGNNRLLNLGDASGLTGNLQARLTGNANFANNTSIQFSAINDAAGSAIQFAGGTSDGNQLMTVAYNGSGPLVFDNRQIQILERLTSNWEIRYNIIANNSGNAANTWTINTDLLYTGGSAITAFGGSLQTGRTFVLSGSNTGGNAFNGVIGNGQNTNGLNFEKRGGGKWILGGDNTYTGSTTVTEGTLIVNGDQSAATGAVAVNGTSTLGGSGTLGGSVIVAAGAKLAPGTSVGTLGIGGGLDISAPAGGAGKLFYELGTIASSDRIAVTGGLAIGDGVLGINDFDFTNVGGLEEGVYTLISSSGITGTLNGADLSGDIDGTEITLGASGGNIILTVGEPSGTPYELWAGTGVLFDEDENGDGVSNGLAFLLGAADPDVSALGLLPTVTETGGGLVMTFDMLDSASRGTATLSVEHSSDLGITDAWTTVAVPDTSGGPTSGVTFAVSGSGTLDVEATIGSGEADGGKLFGRLKATE